MVQMLHPMIPAPSRQPRWKGSAITELTVPLRRRQPKIRTDEDTVDLIRRLAVHYPDAQIAGILNRNGLKTGNIDESGYALVGSAVENDQRLIVALNGCKNASERAEDARKLLLWGFRSLEPKTLFEAGETVGSVPVYGGEPHEVPVAAAQKVKVFLPRGSGERLQGKIVFDGPLAPPLKKGATVARLKVTRGQALALDIPLEDIQALVNNNLIGTLIVCKVFVVPMRERGHGTVVNLASTGAHLGVSNGAIYSILKAAVAHYTRCLARELVEHGVRVNAVSPGPVATP